MLQLFHLFKYTHIFLFFCFYQESGVQCTNSTAPYQQPPFVPNYQLPPPTISPPNCQLPPPTISPPNCQQPPPSISPPNYQQPPPTISPPNCQQPPPTISPSTISPPNCQQPLLSISPTNYQQPPPQISAIRPPLYPFVPPPTGYPAYGQPYASYGNNAYMPHRQQPAPGPHRTGYRKLDSLHADYTQHSWYGGAYAYHPYSHWEVSPEFRIGGDILAVLFCRHFCCIVLVSFHMLSMIKRFRE